jgi:hypothetical protein
MFKKMAIDFQAFDVRIFHCYGANTKLPGIAVFPARVNILPTTT